MFGYYRLEGDRRADLRLYSRNYEELFSMLKKLPEIRGLKVVAKKLNLSLD